MANHKILGKKMTTYFTFEIICHCFFKSVHSIAAYYIFEVGQREGDYFYFR